MLVVVEEGEEEQVAEKLQSIQVKVYASPRH